MQRSFCTGWSKNQGFIAREVEFLHRMVKEPGFHCPESGGFGQAGQRTRVSLPGKWRFWTGRSKNQGFIARKVEFLHRPVKEPGFHCPNRGVLAKAGQRNPLLKFTRKAVSVLKRK